MLPVHVLYIICMIYIADDIMFHMNWSINFHDDFDAEFEKMDLNLQKTLLAQLRPLVALGPDLGRPKVDTLNGSKHTNMKELRFNHDGGVWRVAFAFDPERNGILLVAGDKGGENQKKFYKTLIHIADKRYEEHLSTLE